MVARSRRENPGGLALDRPSPREREIEEAWTKHIERSANRAMALFGDVARHRKSSMRAVAQRAGVTIKAFQHYFDSRAPTIETMTKVAKALDLWPLAARALVGELTTEDILRERLIIRGDITNRGAPIFGEREALAIGGTFWSWSQERSNRQALVNACIESILARLGLSENPSDILGPGLGVIERALAFSGFSMRPFIQDERQIIERRREGASWFWLLCTTLGILEQDALKIRYILQPYGIPTLEEWTSQAFSCSSPDEKADIAAQIAAEEAYHTRRFLDETGPTLEQLKATEPGRRWLERVREALDEISYVKESAEALVDHLSGDSKREDTP